MPDETENLKPEIQPLPIKRRKGTFRMLLLIFVVALPLFILYATGYRYDFGGESFVSTGGIYIGAEREDTVIYVDDELIREGRAFRKAFYAKSLEPGTHHVSVQKEGHHTWVKELPVYAHLVTEAESFNLPLVPQVRMITEWKSATGSAVIFGELPVASSTNETILASSTATTSYRVNGEYEEIVELFSTTTATSSETFFDDFFGDVGAQSTSTATSSEEIATTTVAWRGVKLYEQEGGVYANWIDARDDMPYYYCFEPFEPYSTSTVEDLLEELGDILTAEEEAELEASAAELIHPVQMVPEDAECSPVIEIDRQWEEVYHFDFYPGSTDLVILARSSGIYLVEIDNRAWQNTQPLILGEGLDFRVENGQIFVEDSARSLYYQLIVED